MARVFNRAAKVFETMGLFIGPDKCAVQHFVHGKKVLDGQNVILDSGEIIQYLEQGKGYTYLGFQQEDQVQHKAIKIQLSKNFQRNCKTVWCSELLGFNKVKAYNQLVVSKLTALLE